jgi:hypothetical protein
MNHTIRPDPLSEFRCRPATYATLPAHCEATDAACDIDKSKRIRYRILRPRWHRSNVCRDTSQHWRCCLMYTHVLGCMSQTHIQIDSMMIERCESHVTVPSCGHCQRIHKHSHERSLFWPDCAMCSLWQWHASRCFSIRGIADALNLQSLRGKFWESARQATNQGPGPMSE